MWERFGIRPVASDTAIGESNNELYYSWSGRICGARQLNAFVTHSDWLAIRAETEKDGQLVNHITN